MYIFVIVILSILVLFLFQFGLYLLIGYSSWHFAMSRKSKLKKGIELSSKLKRTDIEKEYFKDFEKLNIITQDNLKLLGFYKNNNCDKLAIIVHGYGGSHFDMYNQTKLFERKDYDTLVVDLRAHGESEGDMLTMGKYESQDLLSWIDFMLSMKNYKIALYGISMGASSILLTISDKKAKNIILAIEDCGFDNANREFSYIFSKSKIKRKLTYNLFYSYTKKMKNIDLKQIDIAKSLKSCSKPILFIHGDKDNFVPTEMVFTLFDSANEKNRELYIAKDATHGNAFEINPNLYRQRVYSFLNKYGM